MKDIIEGHRLLRGRLRLSCMPGADYVADNIKKPLFIDPPYFGCGDRLYREKMTFTEYVELSRLLRKARSWVLTLDDNPAVRQMYSWACVHIIPARYNIDSTRPRRASAQELVITPN